MELYAFDGRAPESISKDEFQKYDGSLIITNGKRYHQVIRNKRSEAFFIAHYETMMKMDGYLYLRCVSNIIINRLACAIQNGSFDIEYLQHVSAEDIKDLVSYLHMYMIPLSFDKYTAEIRDLARETDPYDRHGNYRWQNVFNAIMKLRFSADILDLFVQQNGGEPVSCTDAKINSIVFAILTCNDEILTYCASKQFLIEVKICPNDYNHDYNDSVSHKIIGMLIGSNIKFEGRYFFLPMIDRIPPEKCLHPLVKKFYCRYNKEIWITIKRFHYPKGYAEDLETNSHLAHYNLLDREDVLNADPTVIPWEHFGGKFIAKNADDASIIKLLEHPYSYARPKSLIDGLVKYKRCTLIEYYEKLKRIDDMVNSRDVIELSGLFFTEKSENIRNYILAKSSKLSDLGAFFGEQSRICKKFNI